MPDWLKLPAVIVGFVVWTALLAAAVTGRWRTFGLAFKQYTLLLLALAALGIITAVGLFIWPPSP